MSDIAVHIEYLVLEGMGVQPRSGQRLGQMIEIALQRLLEQGGVPSGLAGGDVREIIVPNMSLPMNAGDRQIADGLALALYRALNRLE